jgi:phage tail sheath protein FI
MPSALTYPGVYVEEIPSGVRTITGVATSITAFIGRARRGPTNKATTINSFGDFETIFGGLWESSSLGFAVRDFFLNGGGQAIIVRLYHSDAGNPQANPPVPPLGASQKLSIGDLKFVAASEGSWGVALRAEVDTKNITDDMAKTLGAGLTKADVFNLTVRDTSSGKSEKFANVTVKPSSRQVDKVLEAGSSLIRYDGKPKDEKPKEGFDPLSVNETAWSAAKLALVKKQNEGGDTTEEKKAVDKAKDELDKAINAAAKAISDGPDLGVADFLPDGGEAKKEGLYALAQADLFNILCIPPYKNSDVDVNLVSAAAAYCEQRRAMLLVDPPSGWTDKSKAVSGFNDAVNDNVGTRSRNAAIYFPRVRQPNPLHDNQMEIFAPCGAVAGTFARTDAQRGVWKAPAGLDASLVGVPSLSLSLTDAENGELNPLGVNCLRAFQAAGRVVWGARTLRGSDQLADEYKYVPVRRTALYIEESLYRGLKWVVFEPNDEPLWAQIRLNVGAFMHNLFRQGAFQGTSPRDAYFVKCDKETTTQNDIDLGIVNIVVGFAPLKPAEFVIIKLQQMAGSIEV